MMTRETQHMIYTLTIVAGLLAAWLFLKKRQPTRYVMDCRDQSYLSVFHREIQLSDRGMVAAQLSESNPAIADDREFFLGVCYSSGVKPDLAAHAWIDRALSARFRHKPH
jgi:hypothetical protein